MEFAEQSHLHLRYALQKGTESYLRFVDDVPRGQKCNCVCPYCKVDLMAKKGQIKEHHFAHKNNKNCTGARMTALHIMAQNVLAETKQVMLPEYNGNYYKHCAELKTFERVEKEQICRNEDSMRRPDCIGYNDTKGGNIWIEIYCRHKIDETKKAEIRAQQQYCIEIDFSDLLKTNYSEEDVKNRLLETCHREWICCPRYDEIEQQREVVEKAAVEKRKKEAAENWRRIIESRRNRQKDVASWFEGGRPDITNSIISEIKKHPYHDFSDSAGEYEYTMQFLVLPNFNFMEFIEKSPKDAEGLKLFYVLLNYYYNKVSNTNYKEIKHQLDIFQNNKNELSPEDRIKLEELVSLRIIYILEKGRQKFRAVDVEENYRSLIKKYISQPPIRNAILMIISVIYHHVIGSNANSFGELTQYVIKDHQSITKLYLAAINSQDKYQNNYVLGSRDMLVELRQYVEGNEIKEDKCIGDILRKCYNYAFDEDYRRRQELKYGHPNIAQAARERIMQVVEGTSQSQSSSEMNRLEELAKAMNKWYQES